MNVKFRTIGAGRFVLTPCRACMYLKIRISRTGRFVSDLFLQVMQVKVGISRAGRFVSIVSQGYVYTSQSKSSRTVPGILQYI